MNGRQNFHSITHRTFFIFMQQWWTITIHSFWTFPIASRRHRTISDDTYRWFCILSFASLAFLVTVWSFSEWTLISMPNEIEVNWFVFLVSVSFYDSARWRLSQISISWWVSCGLEGVVTWLSWDDENWVECLLFRCFNDNFDVLM